jgi:raffinose/stachyose/melibiose transport system substrate-binding protein
MKKVLALMLVLILSMSVFSGCVENDTNTGEVKVEENKTEEVNLKILVMQPRFREQYETYFDLFAKEYEAKTGTKVTYELEMPTEEQILKTRLATKDTIDVFSLHAINDIPSFYKAGYLEDLSDEKFVDAIYDGAKESVMIDGKVVAAPLESLSWGYLYNIDIFDELGLEPAMTISEMEANCKVLKEAGYTPFLLSYNEAWIPQLFLPLITGGFVSNAYPDFVDKMNANETSYGTIDLFSIIDLVNTNGNENALEVGGGDGCAEFANGDYGMWVQGPWFADTILESNSDFNLGVAPLPISENPEETKINMAVSTSLSVSKTSEHKEVARALVSFMFDVEHTSDFFQSVKFSPISKYHTYKNYPWVDAANVYVSQGKSYKDLTIPSAVKDESGKMLQSYFFGDVTQEEVIEALDHAWKSFNKLN